MIEMMFEQRNLRRPGISVVALLVAGCVLSPSSAYAYIDPGANSFLLQGVIGAIAAGLIVVKQIGGLLADRFRRKVTRKKSNDPK